MSVYKPSTKYRNVQILCIVILKFYFSWGPTRPPRAYLRIYFDVLTHLISIAFNAQNQFWFMTVIYCLLIVYCTVVKTNLDVALF